MKTAFLAFSSFQKKNSWCVIVKNPREIEGLCCAFFQGCFSGTSAESHFARNSSNEMHLSNWATRLEKCAIKSATHPQSQKPDAGGILPVLFIPPNL
jgi:hypothetical protein